jgi:hypothetical protein
MSRIDSEIEVINFKLKSKPEKRGSVMDKESKINKKQTNEVYAPGARVSLAYNFGLTGEVKRVAIDKIGASYEVGYWDGKSYREVWLPESEIERAVSGGRLRIEAVEVTYSRIGERR